MYLSITIQFRRSDNMICGQLLLYIVYKWYTVTFQFSHAKQKKVEEQETHAFFIPLRESF